MHGCQADGTVLREAITVGKQDAGKITDNAIDGARAAGAGDEKCGAEV